MSDRWPRRGLCSVLTVLAMTLGLGGVDAGTPPATAAVITRTSARAGLTINPSSPWPGDAVQVAGQVPTRQHKRRRVVLTMDSDGGPIPVARGTTDKNGRFSLPITAPTTPGQVRLHAAASATSVRKHGRRLPLKAWSATGTLRVAGSGSDPAPQQPSCPSQRPSVSALSPAVGDTDGGTQVELTGTQLDSVRSATFGGVSTTEITHVDDQHLTVSSPAGFAGQAAVQLTDCSGAQTPVAASFTYVDPVDHAEASSDVAAHTYTADAGQVRLVEGGGLTGGDVSSPADWWVTLDPEAPLPQVGDPFYLAPSDLESAPAGLAGRTAEVALNDDGSHSVRVTHESLDQVFDSASVDYSGPVGVEPEDPGDAGDLAAPADQHGGSAGSGANAASDETGVNFGAIGPNALLCKDEKGQKASFDGSFGLRLENVHGSFDLDLGNLIRTPSLRTSVTFDVVVSGKVSVQGEISCKLLQSFVKAHTRIVPLGTTGATFSFGPSFEFKITGAGTWEVQKRYRRMVGFHTSGTHVYRDSDSQDFDTESSASTALTVNVEGGALLQIGYADSVGVDERLLLGLEGTASASTGGGVCVGLSLYLELKTQLFLEFWSVFRLEDTLADERVDLASYGPKCLGGTSLPSAAPSGPVITTTSPPSPLIGKATSYRLRTADNRNGQWSVLTVPPRTGTLPPGLALSGDTISGTPTTAGTYLFRVRFTDNTGHVDTADLSMVVRSRPIGPVSLITSGEPGARDYAFGYGGDAQITPDARYVLFPSIRLGTSNLYVLDRTTATTTRVTSSLDGGPLTGSGAQWISQYTAITPDGRYVLYQSSEDDIVANDDNDTTDIFRFDTHTGTTRLVTRTASGATGNGESFVMGMSPSGAWIAIGSQATDLAVPNPGIHGVFYDIASDTLSGVEPPGPFFSNFSDDGCTKVYAGDDVWEPTPGDTNGFNDVLVERGGAYCDGGLGSWKVVSRSPDGDQANGPIAYMGSAVSAAISPNGRYVIWTTCATNMVDDDETECADGGADVIRRDLVTGKNVLISRNVDGSPANGPSSFGDVANDGTVVFISQATDLDDLGTAGGVYLYHPTS